MKEIKTISIKCDTKDYLNIAEMTEMQGNLKARTDIDFDKIKLSIIKYGFSFPFFIWKSDKNYLLDGHGRFATLCKMQKDGYLIPDLPVVYIEAKDKKEAKQKLLRLNSQYGKMTKESVLEFAEDIELNFDEIALPDTVIDFSESEETAETQGDDEAPEVDEKSEPVSKRGEMYELGNSILMCGDSTSAEDVARLMGGEKASLVLTDPPYGMKKENEGVANDNLNFDDLLEFNKKWIALSFEHLKDAGSWYCWGIDEPLMDIYSNILKPMAKENKVTFRNLLTWDKGSGQGENSEDYRMYAIADEKCLFVMNGQQNYGRDLSTWYEGFEPFRMLWIDNVKAAGLTLEKAEKIAGSTYASHYGSKSQYSFITVEAWANMKAYCEKNNIDAFKREYEEVKREYEEVKREYEEVKRAWYDTRAYFNNTWDNMNNVWHFAKTSGAERESAGGHATPKPVALCERAIKSSSRERETVLDFFGGSGSTLIAAEKNNRKALLIELEPKWCDVIRKRWTKWAQENGRKVGSGGLE